MDDVACTPGKERFAQRRRCTSGNHALEPLAETRVFLLSRFVCRHEVVVVLFEECKRLLPGPTYMRPRVYDDVVGDVVASRVGFGDATCP